MKFNEKLSKLRKENNLSQETLAEKLGMSRQAISKWESGSSYPDMATMIRVCKILNCTLEDLLDDDTLKSSSIDKNNKFNITKYMNDFLNFITKSYNMFCSMTFKEKIKCILEMLIVFCILILVFVGLQTFVVNIVSDIFYPLTDSYIYFLITRLGKLAYNICSFALGIIIFLHIFKIRYLDYFITIEDSNIKEKVIEEDIEKKNKFIKESTKEKIIIRDPKHSTYSFFNGLSKIISFIIKLFLAFLLIPFASMFVLLIFIGTISIIWTKYQILFFGIFIGIIGLILVTYDFIELIVNCIFATPIKLKKLFVLFIFGLVLFGFGFGIGFTKFMSMKQVDSKLFYDSRIVNIKMNNNIVFDEMNFADKIIIDNSIEDLIIKVEYLKELKFEIPKETIYINNNLYKNYYIQYDIDRFKEFNNFMNSLKDGAIRNYDNEQPYKIVSITLSEENYNKIINNNLLYQKESGYVFYE